MDTKVPEGGWGWCIVTSAFLSMMMWDGDTKALAVLLPVFQEQFSSQTWLIGSMIAVLSTVLELTGRLLWFGDRYSLKT